MFETDITGEDRTPPVAESEAQRVPWKLVELRALPGYQLFQRFADGTQGLTHMKELIFSDHAGVFTALRDPQMFSQVSIDPDFGSALWANGVDIAPDASHQDALRHGVQVMR